MARRAALRWEGRTLVLQVHAQPNARGDAVCGLYGGAIRIRLAAPPVEGRANRRLQEFLASSFGVPRSRVRILHGAGGRHKRVAVEDPRRMPEWAAALTDPGGQRTP